MKTYTVTIAAMLLGPLSVGSALAQSPRADAYRKAIREGLYSQTAAAKIAPAHRDADHRPARSDAGRTAHETMDARSKIGIQQRVKDQTELARRYNDLSITIRNAAKEGHNSIDLAHGVDGLAIRNLLKSKGFEVSPYGPTSPAVRITWPTKKYR